MIQQEHKIEFLNQKKKILILSNKGMLTVKNLN